jgi:hypothetical protein
VPLGTPARTAGLYDRVEPIYVSRQIKKREAVDRPIPALSVSRVIADCV